MEAARKGNSRPKTSDKQENRGNADVPISNILDSRTSNELILAFAGPVGCGIRLAIDEAATVLGSMGYRIQKIKLSQFIEDAIRAKQISIDPPDLKSSDAASRIISLQDGGNKLREQSSSILAEEAMTQISYHRNDLRKSTPDDTGQATPIPDFSPPRIAYLVDQVKHPDEVALFRKVYGRLFHLIGVISVADKRKNRLVSVDKVRVDETSDLMERDRKQEANNGQQLDKALQMADFFVSTDHGTTPPLQRKLRRFLDLLHGQNGITPTAQEYGMYAAYSAGLKSACLSRQVGAAIADLTGKIVSTGCNDVPKALGGLYSTEDGEHDRRCVHKEEQICFNDREKNSNRADILKALTRLSRIGPDQKPIANSPLISEPDLQRVLDAVYAASHIQDLTEFSRAVHAEMDAIISLARCGTPGISGYSLFTTTFPCHSCARHIVAAGITKVYYIEPYEKSLAQKLHSDAIAFETEDDESAKSVYSSPPDAGKLVRFIHFEGVAPRQYLNFFMMAKRKEKDTGRVIRIAPIDASKTVGEFLDSYIAFEAKVVQNLRDAKQKKAAPAQLAPAEAPK